MSLIFKRKRRTENAPVSVKASGAADAASEVRKKQTLGMFTACVGVLFLFAAFYVFL